MDSAVATNEEAALGDVLLDNWVLEEAFGVFDDPDVLLDPWSALRSFASLSTLLDSLILFRRVRFWTARGAHDWEWLMPTGRDLLSRPTLGRPIQVNLPEALETEGRRLYSHLDQSLVAAQPSAEVLKLLSKYTFLEKAALPVDFHGAIRYDLLGKYLGVPYIPHCLRVPALETVDHAAESYYRNIVGSVLCSLEKARDSERAIIQSFTGSCRTLFPTILSTVLRECSSPSDVLRVAIQLRESSEAEALRSAIEEVVRELRVDDLSKARLLISDVSHYSDILARRLGIGEASQVSFSILGLSISVGVDVTKIREWIMLQRKPHLRFLKKLYDSTVGIQQGSGLVERLFGCKLPVETLLPWVQGHGSTR